jgi:hypothetical protein
MGRPKQNALLSNVHVPVFDVDANRLVERKAAGRPLRADVRMEPFRIGAAQRVQIGVRVRRDRLAGTMRIGLQVSATLGSVVAMPVVVKSCFSVEVLPRKLAAGEDGAEVTKTSAPKDVRRGSR